MSCTDFPACITGTTAPDITRTTINPGSTFQTPSAHVKNVRLTMTAADDIPNVTRVRMCATAAGTDIHVGHHVTAVNAILTAINTREIYASRKKIFSCSDLIKVADEIFMVLRCALFPFFLIFPPFLP